MRHRDLAIAHHDGPALRRRAEEQLREIKRHADAAVAGGVAGEIPRVHADAGVGEPLHVGHGRVVVFFRIILLTSCSRILKTPPGVECPFEPVLTVERPMRMPLRYTCMVCSGTLISTMSGPRGESSGCHQYSPGLSGPVALPVGEPLVWAAGFSTACVEVRTAKDRARTVRSFIGCF